jgi:hypothetical protein
MGIPEPGEQEGRAGTWRPDQSTGIGVSETTLAIADAAGFTRCPLPEIAGRFAVMGPSTPGISLGTSIALTFPGRESFVFAFALIVLDFADRPAAKGPVSAAASIWFGSRFYERDRAAFLVASGPPAPARPQTGHL